MTSVTTTTQPAIANTRVNINHFNKNINSYVKPTLNKENLARIYLKYTPNNIVDRFNNYVINRAADNLIKAFVKSSSLIPIFALNGVQIIASSDKDHVMRIRNNSYAELNPVKSYIRALLRHDKENIFITRFVIPELKKATLTPDELITITTGFVYTLEERFSKNSPLPKEITLKAKSGKSILMHNHVAGSVSKVLYKAIYGDFKGDKIITLQCLDQTLEWFIEGAYTGVFKFDETLNDHIDGANLLDYLEVLTKENLYQLIHAELFD